jgi:hypothetical protein
MIGSSGRTAQSRALGDLVAAAPSAGADRRRLGKKR